jgi:hypothetical protein
MTHLLTDRTMPTRPHVRTRATAAASASHALNPAERAVAQRRAAAGAKPKMPDPAALYAGRASQAQGVGGGALTAATRRREPASDEQPSFLGKAATAAIYQGRKAGHRGAAAAA